MKYYIIAGEASGDLHGSNLMKGLYAKDPEARMRFWGGGLMDAVYKAHENGRGLVQDYKDGAVMGFSQIFLHLRKYAGRLKTCTDDIRAFGPDVVILIDFPGFNFRVAEFCHHEGYKVFYYIAPKVWASRENRVKKLKAWVDKLFIVFPFEKEYFDRKGVSYIYKGNPLIDAIDQSPAMTESRAEFLSRNSLEDKPMIALLAGSRNGEISSMMPVFMEFADKAHALPAYKDYLFVLAAAPARSMEDYSGYIGDREYVKVVFGDSYGVIKNSAAAVVNSGTASLETALIGTPQVVCYGGSEFNFNVAKQIIKINFISLGNLILGRLCFRELIQYYFTADNVLSEVRRLIEDREYRSKMLSGYDEIRTALGGRGASLAVASAMIDELRR
jgi:lipid-A-disaccharide synthase